MARLVLYCERALSSTPATLMAEPLNVVSNFAYVLVGVLAWRWASQNQAPDDRFHGQLLACLAIVVGIGSALFHTFATRWAMIADVVPIALFVGATFVSLLRRRMALGVGAVASWVALLASVAVVLSMLPCRPPVLSLTAMRDMPAYCLNGGLAYLAPIAALMVLAMYLPRDRGWLLLAAAIMFVSLLLRAVDPVFCPVSVIGGFAITGHMFWHCGTALGMLVLMRYLAVDRKI
jgi:hypothetical protein